MWLCSRLARTVNGKAWERGYERCTAVLSSGAVNRTPYLQVCVSPGTFAA